MPKSSNLMYLYIYKQFKDTHKCSTVTSSKKASNNIFK